MRLKAADDVRYSYFQLSRSGSHAAGRYREEGLDYRNHRSGRLLFDRAVARQGIYGTWPDPSRVDVQYAAYQHLYADPHEPTARLFLHYADLNDGSRLVTLLDAIKPDEIYNLAAQSHVRVSFDEPEFTGLTTGIGATRLLEAARMIGLECRYYQASSSEMFGASPPPQNETTPFYPRSPCGVAKVYAYWMTRNYREAYGMHAVNGILFNHESPRHGETFVTRKIAMAAARIASGLQSVLYLGNLDAIRDWGYAKEYVEAMWLILQHDTPADFVIATGTACTVREFVEYCFAAVELDYQKYIRSTNAICAPPKSTRSSGTPAGPRSSSAGRPRCCPGSSRGSWSRRRCRPLAATRRRGPCAELDLQRRVSIRITPAARQSTLPIAWLAHIRHHTSPCSGSCANALRQSA